MILVIIKQMVNNITKKTHQLVFARDTHDIVKFGVTKTGIGLSALDAYRILPWLCAQHFR